MEELNKKLAEWARVGVWHKEAGELEGHFEGSSIDFTESLDACFKWLVPKLKYAVLQFSNQYPDVVPQFSATVSVQFADNHTWADDNPALALCKAIEKLIDGEVRCIA